MGESEDKSGAGASSEPSQKPLSPLEKIRAAAAAKAAASGGAPGAPAASAAGGVESRPAAAGEAAAPAKPLSPLDKIRAAAAKKAEAGEAVVAKGESPAAKAVEPKEKPAPPKPAKPKASEPAGPSRRFFLLTWIGVAWAAFIVGCGEAILAGVRFMFPNVLQEPPTLFKIGGSDKFEDGNVYEQWKNEFGVWIVKNNGQLFAIRTVCTHLGCTPNWLEAEQKFKCPCHGSGFRKTGINFEGPAPRPLERHVISIADDGQVQIDKSRKLQQELGHWTKENGAFIEV